MNDRVDRTPCVVMTATISPPVGATHLRHADPKLRAEEYLRSIQFYAECVGENGTVVFAENSGYDLTQFMEFVPPPLRGRIEWLSTEFHHPASYGKGYGEFRLMDWVVEQSRALRQLSHSSHAWKVTGRLIIRNIRSYLEHNCDSGVICDVYERPKWLDLRLYGFTLSGYRSFFLGKFEGLREDTGCGSPEHRFYAMLRPEFGKGVCPRFHVQPDMWGISGKTGQPYHQGIERWKFRIRQTARMVCPGLWI